MKVPISKTAVVDLTAPVLPAYRVTFNGVARFAVWCKYCRQWHTHGPMDGHREAPAGFIGVLTCCVIGFELDRSGNVAGPVALSFGTVIFGAMLYWAVVWLRKANDDNARVRLRIAFG